MTRAASRFPGFGAVGLLLLGAIFPERLPAEEPAKALATEPAVMKRPLSMMAEWMAIRPLLRDGLIDSIQIAQVQASCPAMVAGVRAGMKVIEIQGIGVGGLTEDAFLARLRALPPAQSLSLKVRALTRPTPLVLTVPTGVPPELVRSRIRFLKELEKSAPVSADQVRQQVAAARRTMEKGLPTVRLEPVSFGPDRPPLMVERTIPAPVVPAKSHEATPTQELLQIIVELEQIPVEHTGVLCEAAARSYADTREGRRLRAWLTGVVIGRDDYLPAQKPVILRSLPELPDLIETVERMKWWEGAEEAVAAGWKRARDEDEPDFTALRRARYALLAAPHGLVDALAAVARLVGDPKTTGRTLGYPEGTDDVLKQGAEILKKCVPLENADAATVAAYVLKHKSKLMFDTGRGVYVLKK